MKGNRVESSTLYKLTWQRDLDADDVSQLDGVPMKHVNQLVKKQREKAREQVWKRERQRKYGGS